MSNMFVKKKRMTEKLINLARKCEENHGYGTNVKGFHLNYSNKCNFTCPHCFTKSGAGEFGETKLTLEDIRKLADEADEMGAYEIDVQGGEPLLNRNLFEILDAIGTERFYVYVTTNGWLLDENMAHRLAAAGVDRVSVSIDAFTAKEHDAFRKKKGSFDQCIRALEYTQQAGMKAYVNIVVGHYNARDKELEEFVSYLEERNWGIVFNCASPSGNWKGNYDVMLTEEDTRILEQMKRKHPDIIRDLWNFLNPNDGQLVYGCPAVNWFYVTPAGDILPCPYIHTKLGNIKEEPLKAILDRGFSVKKFRDFSSKCLSGEDVDFARKYMNHDGTILQPAPLEKVFGEEDRI